MKLKFVLMFIYLINEVFNFETELGRLSQQSTVVNSIPCFTENYQDYLTRLQNSLDYYTKACDLLKRPELDQTLKYYLVLENFHSRLTLNNPKLINGEIVSSLQNENLGFIGENKSMLLTKISEIVALIQQNRNAFEQVNFLRRFIKNTYIYSTNYPKFMISNLKRLIKYNKIKIHLSNILVNGSAKQTDCLRSGFDYIPIVADQIEFMSESRTESISLYGNILNIDQDSFDIAGIAVSFWINENGDVFNAIKSDALEIFNGIVNNKKVNSYTILRDKQDPTKFSHIFRFSNNTITIPSTSNCSQYTYVLMTIQKVCDSYKLILSMRFAGVNQRSLFDLVLQKDDVERLSIVFNNSPYFSIRKLNFYKNFMYTQYEDMKTLFGDFEEHSYDDKINFHNGKIPIGALKECKVPPSCIYSSTNNFDSCDICKKELYNYNKQCVEKCPDGTYPEKVTNKEQFICQPCPEDCETCTDKNNCKKCKSTINNILFNGKCGSDCPENTLVANKTIDETIILTCIKCDENCDFCTGNKCAQCKQDYYNYLGKCVRDCSEGYYKNEISRSCVKCDTRCRSCEPMGYNQNKCKECNKGYFLLNGYCYDNCYSGYRQDNAAAVCQECLDNCDECPNDRYSCTSCKNGFEIKTDPLSGKNSCVNKCNPGSVLSNGACALCVSDDCLYCDSYNLNNCRVCKNGFFLKEGKCERECGLGYYLDYSSNKCQRCSVDCEKCTEGNNKCLNCISPKLLLNDLSCVENCPEGYVKYGSVCLKCQNSDKCRQCSASNTNICINCFYGLFLNEGVCIKTCPNKSFPKDGICAQCMEGCEQCNNIYSCSKCSEGYVKKNGVCVRECGSGFALNDNWGTCEKCSDPSCDSCSSTNLSTCLKCSSDSYLYNLKCVSKCPAKTFVNNYRECNNCKEGCLECTNANDCKLCLSGKYLQNGVCKETCDEGFTNNLGVLNECVPCIDSSCRKCNNKPDRCDECIPPKISLNGQCLQLPPARYFVDDNDNKIKKCDDICKQCEKIPSKCTSCPDGLKLVDSTCTDDCPNYRVQDTKDNKKCNDCAQFGVCKKCNPFDLSECFSCEKGYKLDSISKKCVTICPFKTFENQLGDRCEKCPDRCDKCESNTGSCIKCSQGHSLLGKVCIEGCPSRFVEMTNFENYSSTCTPCISKYCKSCFSGNKKLCYECEPGFALHDGLCVENCPAGFNLNPYSNKCYECSVENCDKCYTNWSLMDKCSSVQSTKCYSCKEGFYLQSNMCIKSCSEGLVANKITNICEPCDVKNCKNCNRDKSICDWCLPGFYYNYYQNVCEPDCRYGTFLNKQEGRCEPCGKDCIVCTSKNSCTTCDWVSVLFEGRCPRVCPIGYAINYITRSCDACKDEQCLNCIYPEICTICKPGSYLFKTGCVKVCPDGYYMERDTLTCKRCSIYCKRCTSYNECIECEDKKQLIEGRYCVDICPDKTISVNGQCTPCKTNGDCIKCDVVDLTKCNYCKYPKVRINGYCRSNCDDGYYDEKGECNPCPNHCRQCLDGKICKNCWSPYILKDNQCVDDCGKGFFPRNGKCNPCPDYCPNCADENSCKDCDKPLKLSSPRCVLECEMGKYYQESSNKCIPCGDNCKDCRPNGICTDCIDPYYLKNAKCVLECGDGWTPTTINGRKCETCNSYCKRCNPLSKACDECYDDRVLFNDRCVLECPLAEGYYLNRQKKKCEKCPIEDCVYCPDPLICQKCIDKRYLYKNKCDDTCPDGTYRINGICNPCKGELCSTCSKNYPDCDLCKFPNYLYKTNCVPTCPPNTYIKDRSCYDCMTDCEKCPNSDECEKCKDKTNFIYIPSLKKKICLSDCGIKKTYDEAGICVDCKTKYCEKCKLYKPEECETCEKDYYLYFNGQVTECVTECRTGTYLDVLNKICKPCGTECPFCQDLRTCKKCNKGWVLDDGYCKKVCPVPKVEIDGECVKCEAQHCQMCSKNDRNKCEHCDEGFYLKEDKCVPTCDIRWFIDINYYVKKCMPCSSYCQECRSFENCIRCDSPYKLFKSACLPECPLGWYADSNRICQQCSSNCKNCNENGCIDCFNPFVEQHKKCVPSCDEGYKLIDNHCIPCSHSYCSSCKNDIKECDYCKLPYGAYNRECYNPCPRGYTNVGGVCKKCLVEDCAVCPPEDLSKCIGCIEGHLHFFNNIYYCKNHCDDGLYSDNRICKNCEDQRCRICPTKGICDYCKENFKLLNGVCLDKCPEGFIAIIKQVNGVTSEVCEKCKTDTTHCNKCLPTDLTQCDECSDNYYLFNNNCYPSCPVGTYVISKGKCGRCDIKCKRCLQTAYDCPECNTPYVYNRWENKCMIECPIGYVNINGVCEKCLTDLNTCDRCTPTNLKSCVECKLPYKIYKDYCVGTCPPGTYYDSNTNRCYDCIENCEYCINPYMDISKLVCKNCREGNYRYQGKCVKVCPNGTTIVNDECQKCYDSYCRNCDGTSTGRCKICEEPYFMYNGECIKPCPMNYYGEDGVCKKCGSYCNKCNSYKDCIGCTSPKILSNGECIDPKCTLPQVLREGVCYTCTDPCKDCNPYDLRKCISCLDDYYLFIDKCVKECPIGYYAGPNRVCDKCSDNCNKCPDKSQCGTCTAGYYKLGNECVRCLDRRMVIVGENCAYCNVYNCDKCLQGFINKCDECTAGTFLTKDKTCETNCINGFYKNLNKCDPCKENCIECENFTGKCIRCKLNYFIFDGECVIECPVGFTKYLDPLTNIIRCSKCRDTNCNKCKENSPAACIGCYSPYFIFNEECVRYCPTGYIISSEKICERCPAKCKSCKYPEALILANSKKDMYKPICDECELGYKLRNGICVEECGPGYFEDDKAKCNACVDTNCKKCNPEDVCRDCNAPYYLDKTKDRCVLDCSDGLYKNILKYVCDPCSLNCKLCRDGRICDVCQDGYKYYNGTCVLVCPVGYTPINSRCERCTDQHCLKCLENKPDQCIGCDSVTFLVNSHCSFNCTMGTYPDTNTNKCEPCNIKCKSCLNAKICDGCKPEFYLENGQCINKCLDGKVERDGKCVCCSDHNCHTCLSDLKTCVKCSNEFLLLENECVKTCPVGYFKNNNRQCQRCLEGCEFCFEPSLCRKCSVGYYLNNQNKCVKQCDTGFYGDCNNGMCLLCHESCEICGDGTNKKCPLCAQNFYKSDGLCVSKENCKFGTFPEENKRECISCKIPNCDLCLNKDICRKCINGYTLSKDGLSCSEYKTYVNVLRTPNIFSQFNHDRYTTFNEYSIYEQLKSSCVESKYFSISFWMRLITSDIPKNLVILEIKEKDGQQEDQPQNKTYINFKLVSTNDNDFKCVSEVKHGNFASSEAVYDGCSFTKLNNWNFFTLNLNNDREATSHNLIVYDYNLGSTFYVRKNLTNFFDRTSTIISKYSNLYINPQYKSSPIFEIANMYLMEYMPNTKDIDNTVSDDKPFNCDSQCSNCDFKTGKCISCHNGNPNSDGFCPSSFISINQGLLHIKESNNAIQINSLFSSRYLSSNRYTLVTGFYVSYLSDLISLFSLSYKNNNLISAQVVRNSLQIQVANLQTNKFINSPNNKIDANKWYILSISITREVISVQLYDSSDVSNKQILIRDDQPVNNNDYVYRLTPDASLLFLTNSVTFNDVRLYSNNILSSEDLDRYLKSFKCSDNCATCDNNLICLKCNTGYEFNPSTKECGVLSIGKPSLSFFRKSIYSENDDKLKSQIDYMNGDFTMSIWMRKNLHSPLIPQNGKTDRVPNNLISFYNVNTKRPYLLFRQEVRENFESVFIMDNNPLISEAGPDKPNRSDKGNYLSYYFRKLELILSPLSQPVNPNAINQQYSVNYKNTNPDWIHVAISQELKNSTKVMTVYLNDRNANYNNKMTFNLNPTQNLNHIILGDSSSLATNMDFGPNDLYIGKVFTEEAISKIRDHPPKDCDPSCLDCEYSTGYCKLCAKDNLQGDKCKMFYYGKTSVAVFDIEKYNTILSTKLTSNYNVFLKDIFKNSINSNTYSVVGWFQLFSIENYNSGESLLFRLSNSDSASAKEDDPLYRRYPGLNLISLKILYQPQAVFAFVISDSDKEKVIEIKNVSVVGNQWISFTTSMDVQNKEFSYQIGFPMNNQMFSGKQVLEFIPQKLQDVGTLKFFGLDSTIKQTTRPAFGNFYNTYVVVNRLLDNKNTAEYKSLIDPAVINNIPSNCHPSCTKCLLGNCFTCDKGYMLSNNDCVPEKLKASYVLITDQNDIVKNRFTAPIDSSTVISDAFGFQVSIRKNFFSGKASLQKIIEFGEISFLLDSSETDTYIKIQNKNDIPSTISLGPLDPNATEDYDWYTVVLNFKGKQSLLECLLFSSKSVLIETKSMKYQIQGKSFDSVLFDDMNDEISLFGGLFIIGYDKMSEPLLLTPEVDCPLDCVYCEKNNFCKLCTYGNEFVNNDQNYDVCKSKLYNEKNMIISSKNLNKNVLSMSSIFSNKKLIRFRQFMISFSLSIKNDYKFNNILKIINNSDTSLKNYDPQNINYNILTLSCSRENNSIKFKVSYQNRHTYFKFKQPVTKDVTPYPSAQIDNDMNYIGIGYNGHKKSIVISLINSEENRVTESIKIEGEFENLGRNTNIVFLDDFVDLNKDNINASVTVKDIKFGYEKAFTAKEIEKILLPNYRTTAASSCAQLDSDSLTCKKCTGSNILLNGRCISKNSNPSLSYALYTDKVITKFKSQEFRPYEVLGASNTELKSFTLQFMYRRFSYAEMNLNPILALSMFDSTGNSVSNVYELYESNNSIIGIFKFQGTDTIAVLSDFTDKSKRFNWLYINVQVDLSEASNTIYVYNFENKQSYLKKSIMLNKPSPGDAKIYVSDQNKLGINYIMNVKEITIDSSIISNPPITRVTPGETPEIKLSNLILTANYLYNDSELISLRPTVPLTCKCACPCINNTCPEFCQLDRLWINLSTNLSGKLKTVFDDINATIKSNNANYELSREMNDVDSVIDYNTLTLSFNLKVQSILNNVNNANRIRFSRTDKNEQISSKIVTNKIEPNKNNNINSVQSSNDDPAILLVISNQLEFFTKKMSSGGKMDNEIVEYPIISFKIVNKKLRLYFGSFKPTMYLSYRDVDVDLTTVDSLFVLFYADFNENSGKLIVYADNKRIDIAIDINFSVENINSRTFYYTNNALNEVVLKLTNNIDVHFDRFFRDRNIINSNLCPKTCKTCTSENRCLECSGDMKMYNNACIKAKNDKNNPLFRNTRKMDSKKHQNALKGKIYTVQK